jgi:16S rRNA (adenine1518-N6/adenine1519-N6)-dimethyltransferase
MTKFETKKSLGQHFLIDNNVINTIINSCIDINKLNTLEIGPGNCALTNILIQKAKHLFCIEKDERLQPMLNIMKTQHNNFDFIIDDALHFDANNLTILPNILISNLPYNVGTQIYLNYLLNTLQHHNMQYFILMFQKEVAYRIMAKPSSSNYGRLSIISNVLADIELVCLAPSNCFAPAPKVDSAVIKVVPLHKTRYNVDINILEKLTNIAFLAKRKTIRNNLKNLDINLENLNINPQLRPQDISVEDYCKMANYAKENNLL